MLSVYLVLCEMIETEEMVWVLSFNLIYVNVGTLLSDMFCWLMGLFLFIYECGRAVNCTT